jgi:hypothetical protein
MSKDWNGIAIGQKFFQRANGIHPDDDPDTYSENLAKQNLYYACYMMAFSKDEFQKMLANSMEGKVEMPKEDELEKIDVERYRKAFADEARSVMNEML